MMREFTGIRSPPTARISISASSRKFKAAFPSSSAAFESVRPPAENDQGFTGPDAGWKIMPIGEEEDTKPDIGDVLRGLSYKPNASSSTIQTFVKLRRRWL